MKLHDRMDDAVSTTLIDLDRLAGQARSEGVRIRRRRRLVSAAGGLTVAGIVVATAYVVLPTQPQRVIDQTRATTAGQLSGNPDLEDPTPPLTVRATGRSTAAALLAAVEEVAVGKSSAYAGEGGVGSWRDTYAEMEFRPADGLGVGVVGVNVQKGSILRGVPFDCSAYFMLDCSVWALPNGDRIRTYQDLPTSTNEGDGLSLVAERLTAGDQLRVVASATNGFNLPHDKWDVTRKQPVLTTAQLVDVVSHAWWGLELPAKFETQGGALTEYVDLDAEVAAEPVESMPGAKPSASP